MRHLQPRQPARGGLPARPRWARRARIDRTVPSAAAALAPDVAIVGSGVVGLCIAHRLLSDTDLSVVILDQKQPCAGATGAGQGYIWMAHRDPSSPSWALAARSKAAWEGIVASNPRLAAAMEWQATGSLLLATTAAEVEQMQRRVAMLQQHGVAGVQLLEREEVQAQEAALQLPAGSAGLLVASDAQINGRQTAFGLLDECQRLGGASGQFQALMQEPVLRIEGRAAASGGAVVVTDQRRIAPRQATIVAAGVWSGQLLAAATGQPAWQAALQPRRGHLLELQPPAGMPGVVRGLMELSYTSHYSSAGSHVAATSGGGAGGQSGTAAETSSLQRQAVDITFTATTSASGSLLVGSSREFSGWSTERDRDIVAAILQRAASFLPALAGVSADEPSARVGLRPYAVGGLPIIGPVEGCPGLFVAAGHEGSGLCLGPATAELVLRHALGPGVVGAADLDAAAFAALLPAQRVATT